jgi:hypothetical protein
MYNIFKSAILLAGVTFVGQSVAETSSTATAEETTQAAAPAAETTTESKSASDEKAKVDAKKKEEAKAKADAMKASAKAKLAQQPLIVSQAPWRMQANYYEMFFATAEIAVKEAAKKGLIKDVKSLDAKMSKVLSSIKPKHPALNAAVYCVQVSEDKKSVYRLPMSSDQNQETGEISAADLKIFSVNTVNGFTWGTQFAYTANDGEGFKYGQVVYVNNDRSAVCYARVKSLPRKPSEESKPSGESKPSEESKKD